MSRPARPWRALPVLLGALLTPAAFADTLVVPGDFATFAEALAHPDTDGTDTIVLAGRVTDTIVIPPGYDGLTIKGKGKRAILDAHQPEAEAHQGPAIQIGSHGVTVRGITIAHAAADAISSGGDTVHGTTLIDLVVVNGEARGIVIDGDDTTIRGCTLRGLDNEPLLLTGQRAVVTGNVFSQVAPEVRISGDDAVVSMNLLASFSDVANDALDVSGDRALVSRNVVRSAGSIVVSGADAVIDRNRVEAASGQPPLVVEGTGHRVSRNVLVGAGAFSEGLQASGSGLLIEKNRIEGTAGEGLLLSVSDSTVRRNVLVACSADEESAVLLSGDRNVFEGNRIADAYRDGVLVEGGENVLGGNRVTGCTEDGIVVLAGASDTLLVGNAVFRNGSEGVENRGTGTVLRKNTVKGNRIDVVNAEGATLEIEANNTIGDGSDGEALPEI